jgi:hypothetical protein
MILTLKIAASVWAFLIWAAFTNGILHNKTDWGGKYGLFAVALVTAASAVTLAAVWL